MPKLITPDIIKQGVVSVSYVHSLPMNFGMKLGSGYLIDRVITRRVEIQDDCVCATETIVSGSNHRPNHIINEIISRSISDDDVQQYKETKFYGLFDGFPVDFLWSTNLSLRPEILFRAANITVNRPEQPDIVVTQVRRDRVAYFFEGENGHRFRDYHSTMYVTFNEK